MLQVIIDLARFQQLHPDPPSWICIVTFFGLVVIVVIETEPFFRDNKTIFTLQLGDQTFVVAFEFSNDNHSLCLI